MLTLVLALLLVNDFAFAQNTPEKADSLKIYAFFLSRLIFLQSKK